jgi:hypothetical protein
VSDEADKKRKLVKEVNSLPGGWARRWEDRWAVGVLDLLIKLPGHPLLWAEGKIVDHNLFAPTLAQYVEGTKLIASGQRPILIGWKQSLMFISPWVKKAHIDDCFSGPAPWLKTLQDYLK